MTTRNYNWPHRLGLGVLGLLAGCAGLLGIAAWATFEVPGLIPASVEPRRLEFKDDSASYVSPRLADGRQRAFPTATGHGAAAKGGRGGRIVLVTNTADSGKGSLRACIEEKGPRTCVFRVSGTIELLETSLVIDNPYLTIAGETAPGEGIAIRNGPLQPRPSVEVKAHDIIIRHLRIRPGPHAVPSCCSGALGLYTANAHDIMIDHVSTSWGSDETVDSEGAVNVTFQWCIFSEPLLNGGPGKRNRARNMLLTRGGNLTIANSLFAFGVFRNPQIVPSLPNGKIDIVNNVLYSPVWDYVISLEDRWAEIQANIIGNYKVAGLRSINDRLVHLFERGGKGFKLYFAGNIDESYEMGDVVPQVEGLLPDVRRFVSESPLGKAPAATDAKTAYAAVLRNAGATRPRRDSVDKRVVSDVQERTGEVLKARPEKVGGWPKLKTAAWPPDVDGDGMADAWEVSLGLDPRNPADGITDLDNDGWTNFEEYLHELAGDAQ